MISLLFSPHVAKFTSSSLPLTVAEHLRQKNYSTVFMTCYSPKEKTRFANPKLDLAEQVTPKMPTGRESIKGLKHKGGKWEQPAQCFSRVPKQWIALMGVLYWPVGPEPIAFSGSMTNDREDAESTHVVVEGPQNDLSLLWEPAQFPNIPV